MNDPFPEELLSAYLDGELPREERASVEQWLAASAEHRRLFDDLQAIRRELQALPRQSLDTGFSDRVLTAIRERSGDSSASPPGAVGASTSDGSGETSPVPPKPTTLPPRHLGMPAWRWFAAGVAATLAAVLVGINAVPDTMAQIGKLAQIRLHNGASEGVVPAQAKQPGPAATVPAPRDTAKAVPGTVAPQSDTDVALEPRGASRSMSGSVSEDAQLGSTNKPESRKEIARSERVESPGDAPPPADPDATNSDASSAAGAAARQFDKKVVDADARETMSKQALASPPSTAAFADKLTADEHDKVVELPVTDEQADRALAFYSQSIERQAARRYSNVVTLTAQSVDEKSADRYAAEGAEEALQRTAPGMSLMKLMDAATQGVQVAALEVTGPETEVQALLDSLGVAEARDLRPSRELFGGGGAGGVSGRRVNRERQKEATGTPLSSGPQPKPAATAGQSVAKSDSVAEKAEEAKRGSTPKSDRQDGVGEVPTVKMRSVLDGSEGTRDQVKGVRDVQQAEGDAFQRQLRVRLVIVPPQADPIGPTIEVKPSE